MQSPVKPRYSLFYALLLAWSLLLAGQGALVHGYSHHGVEASQASDTENQSPEKKHEKSLDSACAVCLSFAHLDGAAPPGLTAFALQGLVAQITAFAGLSAAGTLLYRRLARGPPAFH